MISNLFFPSHRISKEIKLFRSSRCASISLFQQLATFRRRFSLLNSINLLRMEAFEKPVFDGVRYKNPKSFTNWSGLPGIIGMFKWIFLEKDYSKIPSNDVLDKTLPVRKPEFNLESNLSATWLGHSTVFVHLNGISFITDPGRSTTTLMVTVQLFQFGHEGYRLSSGLGLDDTESLHVQSKNYRR